MIIVENLSVEFSAKPLFTEASFVVNKGERVVLVGKNGAGKSTLLKVICGMQQPSAGSVSLPRDTTIGYLPQVMDIADETTVREEARKAFAGQLALKRRLGEMEQEMARRNDYDSPEYMALVERFTHTHEQFQLLGGEGYEADLERTLLGLGFRRTDLDRPTAEFSGGWRMRVELAKILLRRPDVLLLDEPTNHLDIQSIEWLEQFLMQSSAAVILVSHDRAFINNVTNRTLEISCGKIIDYRVKYDEYVVLRQERREQQLRAYENQQKEIADMQAFIDRFRYQATKAVQVQQKIKQLERIVPIEVDEVDRPAMHLKFPPCLRSGDYPIICDGVGKAYGDHRVFSDVSFTLRRGEKVAFVGRNGGGKTTLVRCIMGQTDHEGTLKIGHQVQIGYFAQNQASLLDDSKTVFQTIDDVARGDIRLRINDILGAFMFGGEASEKRVKVLSGGERTRLSMIRLLLQPVNMLILDEPTNHLDMQSKDVLKEAIRAFDGTAIIVSHDREFLDSLVTKVYEFDGGRVREHLGGVYDWLRKNPTGLSPLPLSISEGSDYPLKQKRQEAEDSTPPLEREGKGASLYAERKEQQKKIRKAARLVADSEEQIAKLEARVAEMNHLLNNPEKAADMSFLEDYAQTMRQLDAENERWMRLSEDLESLRAEMER